ncbi:hypothetical protein JW948_18085 [bacterium]|nr:hypothetical protein [bacterium]
MKLSRWLGQTTVVMITLMTAASWAGTQEAFWEEIVIDDFEEDFGWPVWDLSPVAGSVPGNYRWGRTTEHVASGNYALWCAAKNTGGAPKLNPAYDNYPVNFETRMVYYQRLDLRNCEDAELVFNVWHKMVDNDNLKVMAHPGDGQWREYEFEQSSNSLEEKHLSFKNWNGRNFMGNLMTIAFGFHSNGSGTSKGAFIDNIRFRKYMTGRPDMSIEKIWSGPSHQPPAGLISVYPVLKNIGTFKNSIPCELKYYLSEDPYFDKDGDILIGHVLTGKYYIDDEDTVTRHCMIPHDVPYGEYYVGAVYDPDTSFTDLDRSNNWRVADKKLVVGSESTDWLVVVSEDFENPLNMNQWEIYWNADYSWGITDYMPYLGEGCGWCAATAFNGYPEADPENGNVPGAYVSGYLMRDPPLPMFDCEDAEVFAQIRIESGAVRVVADPGGFQPEGELITDTNKRWLDVKYSLTDWPDFGNFLGHNVYCGVYHEYGSGGKGAFVDNFVIRKKIPERPDLVIDDVSAGSMQVYKGQPLQLESAVRNIGQTRSPASTIHYFLSSDTVLDTTADHVLGSGPVLPLNIGQTDNIVFGLADTGTLPAGAYYVIALADSGNFMAERLELNNAFIMMTPVEIMEPLRPVLLQTDPPAMPVTVDASSYPTPLVLSLQLDSTYTVSADSLIPISESTRLVFAAWSDGGVRLHDVTVTEDTDTLTAYYNTEYQLDVQSSWGEIQGGGWYLAGEIAGFGVDSLVTETQTRVVFASWTGDFTGTAASGQIVMDAPKTVTATWNTQYLLRMSVQDDLGGTVAPGDSTWADAESAVEIAAIPDTDGGYDFSSWTGDIVSTNNPLTFVMDAPKTMTAVFAIPSDVETAALPTAFAVYQNYPNPFNPSTRIAYDIPETGLVRLEVYDLMGRKVRTLVNDMRQPGSYQAVWNGLDDRGLQAASGTYVYVMRCGDFQKRMKAVFLK